MTNTSPPNLDDKENWLQHRINAYASSDLAGSESVFEIRDRIKNLELRGRGKLVNLLGIRRVERIESKAKKHIVNRWIALRKTHGLGKRVKLKLLPKEFRPEREPRAARSELITRKRSGVTKWRLSSGRIVFRDRAGRFVSRPRRQRLHV